MAVPRSQVGDAVGPLYPGLGVVDVVTTAACKSVICEVVRARGFLKLWVAAFSYVALPLYIVPLSTSRAGHALLRYNASS